MQQQLQLNIIPFTAPFQKAAFSFYKQRFEGSYPIFKGDLEGLLDDTFTTLELLELEKLYTDFEPAKDGAIVLEIDLVEAPYFASHFYRHLIRKHFTGIADIMHQNFTSETEVWFLNSSLSNQKYNVYNQFTLKVQYARVTQGHELVLSYDGTTKVLTQSIATINNFQTEFYNWINCEGVLYRWKYFPQHLKGKYDVSYPVVSNTLKPHFEIAFDVPDLKNRYPKYFATETAMRFVMIAYNLMSLFRLLTLQKQPSPTLSTLRFNCFAVGSWIENGVLKMSVPFKRSQWYDSLFAFIENTKLPLSLTG